jgi:ribose/xylose/arabinose/galactoside ABC-type transport system permease subunit
MNAISSTKERSFGKRISSMGNNLSLIIALIAICIMWSFLSPYFMTVENFMNILLASSIVMIRASGATIAMITGGMDISQNAVGAFTGIICAQLAVQWSNAGVAIGPWVLPVLILLSIGLGIAMGAANSTLISIFKINPIITTLGTMQIFRGLAWVLSPRTIAIPNQDLVMMGRGRFLNNTVPISVVIAIGIFILAVWVLKYTTFGRKVYMVGGNENASFLSGINAKKVKFIAYIFSAAAASFAGFLLTCQIGSALPQSGSGTEMLTITAIILGGLSLSGGKGSLVGTFLGIMVLSIVNNGLTLLMVNEYVQMVITGAILILAVLLDVIRSGELKKQ